MGNEIWKEYIVDIAIQGQFGASIPKTPDEIRAMLEHRMPTNKPNDAISIDELTEQVAEEVKSPGDDEPAPFGWAGFKSDDKGLYAEGRTIRGHLKDCAQQVALWYDGKAPHKKAGFPEIKNFRAKFVNRIYIKETKLHLGKEKPDGMETRYIQVMTRQGPRSTIKYVDYVTDVQFSFTISLMNDGVIGLDEIKTVLRYGARHGMGAERSQDWGRYKFGITPVEEETPEAETSEAETS